MTELDLRKIIAEELDKRLQVPTDEENREKYFVRELMDWTKNMKVNFWRTLVVSVTGGIIVLLLLGFACFYWKG